MTPVYFFSHGSTMMLGEESESASYWKQCGDEALAHNIKGVIIMVYFRIWGNKSASNESGIVLIT
jgi:aromatic ring-opening dioxygenase catalytic subunit (LigB family)